MKAKDINALARVLNLATAGSPPEAETGYAVDDFAGYAAWTVTEASPDTDWNERPLGPGTTDTTDESRSGGLAIVDRGWAFAGLSDAGSAES